MMSPASASVDRWRNLLLDGAGASQEVEGGDDEHGDAQHSGEVLRERHSLSCLEDVVEERKSTSKNPTMRASASAFFTFPLSCGPGVSSLLIDPRSVLPSWRGFSAIDLSQHPDEHRPERPILLAVD
jgi:hypothetical protein